MNKKRMWLKATGSTCYGETGITFPHGQMPVNIAGLLMDAGATNVRWERPFNLPNVPKTLKFDANKKIIEEVKTALAEINYDRFMIVREDQ